MAITGFMCFACVVAARAWPADAEPLQPNLGAEGLPPKVMHFCAANCFTLILNGGLREHGAGLGHGP
jgi:hypothetical protein